LILWLVTSQKPALPAFFRKNETTQQLVVSGDVAVEKIEAWNERPKGLIEGYAP
jgi:hypothetical protein